MNPDPHFVSDYLEAVGNHLSKQDTDFRKAVLIRLQYGGEEYGNSVERPLRELLEEVREEAADVPGWLVLVLDRIFAEEASGELEEDLAHIGRLKVIAWAAVAQYLWRDLTDFCDQLDNS